MQDETLLRYIRDSVIGGDDLLAGPFGPRPVIYADYTASGRSLSFVEDYIRDVVLPLYANTHTESSATGLQTSRFRDDARRIIGECVGAGEDHVVLFCGSGATHAIAKMIGVMGLRVPSSFDDRYRATASIPADERPVVFIGPYEHHSNELPWRESIADVVTIDADSDGHISLDHLEEMLDLYAERALLIGSFSAASNVTGITTDVSAVSSLLHKKQALSFWDFAAAAPYVAMDMGDPDTADLAYLDAIFLSPHKFMGGPGTPGVLVARRELFANRVPDIPGGGTVRYVNPTEHDYHPNIEHREEGGTPAIVESIRAGLVFQLKAAVGVETIAQREGDFVRRAVASWDKNPNLDILGSHDAERLSIVSFVVRHNGQHLHHNFVVALLNDLFGIQTRGGCSCAGPYGHRLLGIDLDQSHEFQREIGRGCEGIKPGWIRLSFNYFVDEETFQYIVAAVHFVATTGARFLAQYRFDPDDGLWRHASAPPAIPMSLDDVSYVSGQMVYDNRRTSGELDLRHYVDEAERLASDASAFADRALAPPETTPDFEHLRWFPYPAER